MKRMFRGIWLLVLSLLGVVLLPGAAAAADGRSLGDAAYRADSGFGIVDPQNQLSPEAASQLQERAKRLSSQYGVHLTVFLEPAPEEAPVLQHKEIWIFLEDSSFTVHAGAHVRRVLEPLQLADFQEKWMMPGWLSGTFSASAVDWKAQNLFAAVESLLCIKNGEPVPDSLVLRRYLQEDKSILSQEIAVSSFWNQQQNGRLAAWGVCLGVIAFLAFLACRKTPEGSVPGDGSNFKGGIGSGVMGLTTTQSTSGYTSGTGGLSYSPK